MNHTEQNGRRNARKDKKMPFCAARMEKLLYSKAKRRYSAYNQALQ